MKAYAHPIKEADMVTDTGEWCNESKTKVEPETPQESIIDMDWLKESLEELNWADVSKWIKEQYPEAFGTTIKALVESLTREHQEDFTTEVQMRLQIEQ